jgi:hypothetical protein
VFSCSIKVAGLQFLQISLVHVLVDQVAKEEANIRANPLARTPDILKKFCK